MAVRSGDDRQVCHRLLQRLALARRAIIGIYFSPIPWPMTLSPTTEVIRVKSCGKKLLVFELLGIDAQLTRRKLGKKIHPDHGGRQRPTAAMMTPLQRRVVRQSSNTMCDKSMSLKLEIIIIFTIYLLFKGAAHRRRAAKEQTPNYHTRAAPTSLPQPPQPRATAHLTLGDGWWRFRRWMAAPSL